jgi:hypothetical protein
MVVTVQIPDEIAEALKAEGDISRRIVEAFFAEEYRSGRLAKPLLRAALGLDTSYELDGFLKRHRIWIDLNEQELRDEQNGLERLGL